MAGSIVLQLVNFLGGFFMINGLLVKPFHYFSVFRLIIWFHIANISMAEAIKDTDSWNTYERKDKPVQGRFRWLIFGVCLSELIICLKFNVDSENINHDAETSLYKTVPVVIIVVIMSIYYLYLRCRKDRTHKYLVRPPGEEA